MRTTKKAFALGFFLLVMLAMWLYALKRVADNEALRIRLEMHSEISSDTTDWHTH